MQFVGWALSACITPRLADIYGRKPIFLASMLLQLASLIGIYISRSVAVTTGLIFFFGMGGVGRSSISYLYMQEFLPQNRQTLVGTVLQLNNGFVAVYTVIYYWFISKQWLYINIFAGFLTALSMVGVFFLPESPKFLITLRRYDEARAAINVITRVNKKEPFTSKFDREVIELKEGVKV
jgi:MFS transporter, SP family, sugar:H+ symporter